MTSFSSKHRIETDITIMMILSELYGFVVCGYDPFWLNVSQHINIEKG